jgi:hypothetical protein
MARWVYMLVVFAVLAGWAGAQNQAQPALSAEDKLRLLRTNRVLINSLVHDGVIMSGANDPVVRAVKCRDASLSLVQAIQDAAKTENAERVAELTGLFRELVHDGLVPTMNEARQIVPPQSPSGVTLAQLRENASKDVVGLKALIPTGKMGDNPRIKEALKQLDELAEALK